VLSGPNTGIKEEGCLPVNWQIDYTGSKQVYLRVRPVVEVAEIETIYISILARFSNNQEYWARVPGNQNNYFSYTLGSYTQTNPLLAYF